MGEPGANFPLWKWQIAAVEMLGAAQRPGGEPAHRPPDEPPGLDNTLFHHSFAVDFQRSVKAVAGPLPGSDKPLVRYLLFGPPGLPRARLSTWSWRAAAICWRGGPAMGYHAEEASHTARVVIVGELQDVGQEAEDALRQAG